MRYALDHRNIKRYMIFLIGLEEVKIRVQAEDEMNQARRCYPLY